METLASKFFGFLFLTILGGGWTAPLGLPPGPEDPAVARVAPEKCLFYASWAGMATADPKSKNQTEQLLAEPEVQRCFATLTTLASKTVLPGLAGTKDDNYAASRQAAMDFIKIVATHPAAVFAAEIKNDEGAGDVRKKNIRGGMLVAAGKDADKLRAAFDEFCKQAMAVEPQFLLKEVQIAGHTWYRFPDNNWLEIQSATCGFDGTDFIVGIGDGSVEEILKRRQQQPPAWLVSLRKQLPVERVSAVVYFNIKMLLEQMTADKAMPKTGEALRLLGLDKLTSVSSVSGLEGETFTSKMLLATDGEPQGPLLSLFSDQPLRAEDLKAIPRDATLGFAMRFDARKAVEQFTAMLEKAEPGQRAAIEGPWDALTKSLAVDLRRDLPKALGDTCCVYTSPGEGGLFVLGLTAVVPIKDRDAISVIQAKLLASSLGKSLQEQFGAGPSAPFQAPRPRILSFSFAGQRIFYSTGLSMGLPFLPAWCATEHELIVAMSPQNIMAYLQHGPEHKSLATVPQVSRLIESADAPSMIEYVDTAKLFELAYPFVPLAVTLGGNFLGERQPLSLDMVPSAPAIGRHLVPGTAALRRTKQGLELISRQPLPGSGLLWTGGLFGYESPAFLEQQISAEGQLSNVNRSGAATVPPPAAVGQLEGQPMPGPAGPTVAPPGPAPAPAGAPAETIGPATYAAPPGAPTYSPSTYAPPPSAAPATGYPTVGPSDSPPAYGAGIVGPAPAGAVPAGLPTLAAADRLQGIGAAIKAYRDKLGTMPPAYVADKQGKPLLSWRVALLPYLGQQDLYKRFHLDEPWDSPNNRQLIPLMPDAYQDPDAVPNPYAMSANGVPMKVEAGKTRFLLLRGPKTIYADPTPPMPRTFEEWMKVILVVVVPDRAVPWSKPEEFTYNAKNPNAGIGPHSMLNAGSGIIAPFPSNSGDQSPLLQIFTGEEATRVGPPVLGLPTSTYPPAAAPPSTKY